MQEPSLEEIFGSYTAWKADDTTWFINFMNGSENMYLLEGEEKALLLDTGYGVGNLRAFVETLTDKPILVANTHFHPDHAAGNGEFEAAYMSPGAKIDAPSVFTPGSVPFDLSALPYPDYERIYIDGGYQFDLGGRIVEVLGMKPAHCNSSLCYLDRGHRMLFCGDDMESTQVIMCDNSKNPDAPYDVRERLNALRDNSQMMKDLSDEYDYLLPNHNGWPIAKSYIDDYIEMVARIFDGTAAVEDKLNHKYIEMDPKAPELCRVRWKRASIFIKEAEVMKVYGKGE